MISSQSVPLLTILASSVTLTCLSLIKSTLSKSCHFHIRDIRQIRHLLPLSTATALANSLVSCKLDYCNSLTNQQPLNFIIKLGFTCTLAQIWNVVMQEFGYEYTQCDSQGDRWRVAIPKIDTCMTGIPYPVKGKKCGKFSIIWHEFFF